MKINKLAISTFSLFFLLITSSIYAQAPSGETVEKYPNGKIKKITVYNNDGTLDYIAEYYQNGKKKSRTSPFGSGSNSGTITKYYDESGTMEKLLEKGSRGKESYYIEKHYRNGTMSGEIYKQNGKMSLAKEIKPNGNIITSLYDANSGKVYSRMEALPNNHILKDSRFFNNSDKIKSIEEREVIKGVTKPVKRTLYNKDGSLKKETLYEYYPSGNKKQMMTIPGIKKGAKRHKFLTKTIYEDTPKPQKPGDKPLIFEEYTYYYNGDLNNMQNYLYFKRQTSNLEPVNGQFLTIAAKQYTPIYIESLSKYDNSDKIIYHEQIMNIAKAKSGRLLVETEYTYNRSGKLIERTSKYSDKNYKTAIGHVDEFFDSQERVSEQRFYDADGKPDVNSTILPICKKGVYRYVYEYVGNEKGVSVEKLFNGRNKLVKTNTFRNPNKPVRTTKY